MLFYLLAYLWFHANVLVRIDEINMVNQSVNKAKHHDDTRISQYECYFFYITVWNDIVKKLAFDTLKPSGATLTRAQCYYLHTRLCGLINSVFTSVQLPTSFLGNTFSESITTNGSITYQNFALWWRPVQQQCGKITLFLCYRTWSTLVHVMAAPNQAITCNNFANHH